MSPPRRGVALALALVLAALINGCSGTTRQPVGIAHTPRRVVSLAPSITEILFALGLGDRVVGVTSQDNYPPEAASKEKIGDVSSNIERVLSLRPDLVIGHSFLNSRALASLKKLGVPVLGVDTKDLRSVGQSIAAVAAACGVRGRGEEIARHMDHEIAAIRKGYASTKSRPVVLFAAQASPLWAAGSQTFVDEMIAGAGGANAGRDAGREFSVLSEEVAISRNPDLILVTDETTRRWFATAKAWASVRAVRSSRVVRVNPDLYLRPGPRLVQGLRELAVLLHPEIEAPG